MSSLSDQLAKLFPNLGRGGKQKTAAAQKKSGTPVFAAPVPQEVDWKKGVTPLPASGRRETKTGSPGAADLEHQCLQSVAASSSVKRATAFPLVVPNKPVAVAPPVGEPEKKAVPVSPDKVQQPPPRALFGNARPPALAREAEYKKPDSWVASGAGLQPPGGGSGRNLTVRIGIDFGTAYTKVAMRAGDQLFFVPWNGVRHHELSNYLPGEILIFPDDTVWLGRATEAETASRSLDEAPLKK